VELTGLEPVTFALHLTGLNVAMIEAVAGKRR
jgi:hypothetical protein